MSLLAVLVVRSFNGSSEPGMPLHFDFNPVESCSPPSLLTGWVRLACLTAHPPLRAVLRAILPKYSARLPWPGAGGGPGGRLYRCESGLGCCWPS